MSRWLSSVNNLLEKLDGQVETVVEEQIAKREGQNDDDDDNLLNSNHDPLLETILAKRGLSSAGGDDDENEHDEDNDESDDGNVKVPPVLATTATTVSNEHDDDGEQQHDESQQQQQQQQQQQEIDDTKNNAASEGEGVSDDIGKEKQQHQEEEEIGRQQRQETENIDDDIKGDATAASSEEPILDKETNNEESERMRNSDEADASLNPTTTTTSNTTDTDAATATTAADETIIPTNTTTTTTDDDDDGNKRSNKKQFTGSNRDMLLSFYQQYNPSKVSNVDQLLNKYHGNEKQMFGILAKKYNLDPSQVFDFNNNDSNTNTTSSAPAEPAAPAATPDAAATTVEKQQQQQQKALNKECRTLRRHVVSLNTQLEAAEAEIQAQRKELERAADRFERDRARHKEEKETLTKIHALECKSIKDKNDTAMSEQKKRYDDQLDKTRKQLKDVEHRHMQEGGDWNKELDDAIKRERNVNNKLLLLEDEKSTLLSQISSLKIQQTALESRFESATQTCETAVEREREAEDRLDAALSLQARQLSQRQAREVELERMVAELGAALAVARNREVERLKTTQQHDNNNNIVGENGNPSINARLEECEDELETVNAQLELERQRSETLHQELLEVTTERAEEASATQARQLQSDRQIADMSQTISRLQMNIRDLKSDSSHGGKDFTTQKSNLQEDDNNVESDQQIKALSEQILRQQEKIGNFTSEVSALKARLRAALNRADSAEKALTTSGNPGDVAFNIIERAPASSGSLTDGRHTNASSSVRRRGGGNRGTRADSYGGSIRSAIRLLPGQGEGKEKIGKAIDAMDTWSVETGKYLRYNPLARGGFLLYLMMLHLYTMAVIVFHAHTMDSGGDFGGQLVPHNPAALMQQQQLRGSISP